MNNLNLFQQTFLNEMQINTNYYYPPGFQESTLNKLVVFGYVEKIDDADCRCAIYKRIK